MTWARMVLLALIVAMLAGLVAAVNAHATAKAELEQAQSLADGLTKQIAGLATEYNNRLTAQEEAYRVRDSIRNAGGDRRREADSLITRDTTDEVLGWRNARVPDPVTDSLCLQPGSCTVPGTSTAAGATTPASPGDAAVSLSNESLRAGVEDLRHDLATCNGQLAGIRVWAASLNERK